MCTIDINETTKPLRKTHPSRVAKEQAKADIIFQVICEKREVTPEELKSRNRKGKLARARMIGMYLTHFLTQLSDTKNAAMYDRKHSDCSHGIKRLDKLASENHALAERIKDIRKECELRLERFNKINN